jgi:hypothetical protein
MEAKRQRAREKYAAMPADKKAELKTTIRKMLRERSC